MRKVREDRVWRGRMWREKWGKEDDTRASDGIDGVRRSIGATVEETSRARLESELDSVD